MNKPVTKELRNAPRYQLENPIRLSGCTLPLIAAPAAASRAVEGHVQNISSSGLCLLAQKSLKVSELLVERLWSRDTSEHPHAFASAVAAEEFVWSTLSSGIALRTARGTDRRAAHFHKSHRIGRTGQWKRPQITQA